MLNYLYNGTAGLFWVTTLAEGVLPQNFCVGITFPVEITLLVTHHNPADPEVSLEGTRFDHHYLNVKGS